jgi:hypothetical protein
MPRKPRNNLSQGVKKTSFSGLQSFAQPGTAMGAELRFRIHLVSQAFRRDPTDESKDCPVGCQ